MSFKFSVEDCLSLSLNSLIWLIIIPTGVYGGGCYLEVWNPDSSVNFIDTVVKGDKASSNCCKNFLSWFVPFLFGDIHLVCVLVSAKDDGILFTRREQRQRLRRRNLLGIARDMSQLFYPISGLQHHKQLRWSVWLLALLSLFECSNWQHFKIIHACCLFRAIAVSEGGGLRVIVGGVFNSLAVEGGRLIGNYAGTSNLCRFLNSIKQCSNSLYPSRPLWWWNFVDNAAVS